MKVSDLLNLNYYMDGEDFWCVHRKYHFILSDNSNRSSTTLERFGKYDLVVYDKLIDSMIINKTHLENL